MRRICFFLCISFFTTTGISALENSRLRPGVPVPRSGIAGEVRVNRDDLYKDKELYALYRRHKVEKMTPFVKELFIRRYLMTRTKKYYPRGNITYCTTYFYDYYYSRGYGDLLDAVKEMPGKTMVHKMLTFARTKGRIKVFYDPVKAQELANKGREVGIIGEYYYDKAERYFTRHYGIVQPSLAAFDSQGTPGEYSISGCYSNQGGINGKTGSGLVVVQAGTVNGIIDFRWAYNRKTGGILQKDGNGNLRGGIIFVLFPEL